MQIVTQNIIHKKDYPKKNAQCSFQGLSRKLGKCLYRKSELLKLEVEYTDKGACVGHLPSEFISLIKEYSNSPEEFLLRFNGLRKNMALYFRKLSKMIEAIELAKLKNAKQSSSKAASEQRTYSTAEVLPLLALELQRCGIIKNLNSLELQYLGRGAFADCFTMSTKNNEFTPKVIKIFRKDYFFKEKEHHGIFAEANAAAFVKKRQGHSYENTEITGFHYADIDNGFMIYEHANNYSEEKIKSFYERLGIFCADRHEGNLVNGRLVDMGGFGHFPEFKYMSSPLQLRLFKQLHNIYHKCKRRYNSIRKKHCGTNDLSRLKFDIKELFQPKYKIEAFKPFIEFHNKKADAAKAGKLSESEKILVTLKHTRNCFSLCPRRCLHSCG